jgi:hypothetical protein
MTDEEYRDFLAALAKKFFRPSVLADPQMGANYLVREIERLQSASRLVRVVGENPDSAALINGLRSELSDVRIQGVLEAINERALSMLWKRHRRLSSVNCERRDPQQSPQRPSQLRIYSRASAI